MNRSLSFDNLVAALAILSTTASVVGCSKATPEQSAAPAAAPVPNASISPAATAAPPPPAAAPHAVVDAGRELRNAPSKSNEKNPSASCGAQGCSPEMKKLGK
jgi:hypothetical protein